MLETVQNYKILLNITGSTEDAKITTMATEIESWVQNYLNRNLESAEYVEVYDGSPVLTLNQYPITAVSKIESYDDEWTELVEDTDYTRLIIKNYTQISLEGSTFPTGDQNIRITYTAGYTTIPADVKMICKKLMFLYWRDLYSLGKSTVTNSKGGSNETVTYDADITQKLLKQLDKYKALNV